VLPWLLILAPIALALWAQRRVAGTFARYRAVPDASGRTGAQVARQLLDAHGLGGVGIEVIPGELADHYDGGERVLRLSQDVADGASVAAIGIAAHEVAHAYQDAEGSRAYRVRKRIGEPLARLAPVSGLVLFGGFGLGSLPLLLLSCLYMGGLVSFSVATLPVELGASRRALALLRATGIAPPDEATEIGEVLRAAGLTYVAAVAQQLGVFLIALVLAAAAFGAR
jgi:Zn-dependent membrane protease YugP